MSDTRKTTKPNVPNLRFPGFEGEWDKLKVRDFTRVVAGATPATDKKEYWGGVIRWMNSGELNLKRVYEVQGRITQLGYDKTSTKIIPPHSVLIGLAGQGKTRGTAAMNYVELCTNQSIASILPSDSFYSEFLYQNVESRYKELRDISSGDGGRGGLNLQMIYNLYIPHCSMQEQKKIGDFLYLLDQRIAIQNKVIEKYESLIKALCQILITSPNGTVCHIGDVLKIGSGKDHKHLNIGTIPVFGTGGYMLSVNDWLYEGESVCIGRKGTIDNPFFVDGKFWTVDTLFYTYDFNGVLPKFCYYLFRTINWLQYNEASGVPSLSKSTIERIQIRIPCMDEQAKAVQVLDGVEMEITCRRKLLNLYKSIKQYLISQLFI